jgi:hypothetical protein
MSLKTAWRRWRLKVHDVLEVGGEAHPVGRVVNIFLVILIIANGLAFTAETVDSVYARYGAPGRHAKLHEGDLFGEIALLERRRHKHDSMCWTARGSPV